MGQELAPAERVALPTLCVHTGTVPRLLRHSGQGSNFHPVAAPGPASPGRAAAELPGAAAACTGAWSTRLRPRTPLPSSGCEGLQRAGTAAARPEQPTHPAREARREREGVGVGVSASVRDAERGGAGALCPPRAAGPPERIRPGRPGTAPAAPRGPISLPARAPQGPAAGSPGRGSHPPRAPTGRRSGTAPGAARRRVRRHPDSSRERGPAGAPSPCQRPLLARRLLPPSGSERPRAGRRVLRLRAPLRPGCSYGSVRARSGTSRGTLAVGAGRDGAAPPRTSPARPGRPEKVAGAPRGRRVPAKLEEPRSGGSRSANLGGGAERARDGDPGRERRRLQPLRKPGLDPAHAGHARPPRPCTRAGPARTPHAWSVRVHRSRTRAVLHTHSCAHVRPCPRAALRPCAGTHLPSRTHVQHLHTRRGRHAHVHLCTSTRGTDTPAHTRTHLRTPACRSTHACICAHANSHACTPVRRAQTQRMHTQDIQPPANATNAQPGPTEAAGGLRSRHLPRPSWKRPKLPLRMSWGI